MPDYSDRIRTISSDSKKQSTGEFSPESMGIDELAQALGSSIPEGLSERDAARIRREKGPNTIYDEMKIGFTTSFKNQLKGLMGLFLAVSAFVMYVFEPDRIELAVLGSAVIAIMLVNAVLESAASHSLDRIRSYSSIRATVTRGGRRFVIDSRGLVPGDIITLSAGNIVPADARIISSSHLSVLETTVSGKNEAVFKTSEPEYNRPDMLCHLNMVYAGTVATGGSGVAIVCVTGKEVLTRKVNTRRSQDYTPGLLKYVGAAGTFFSFASVAICFLLLALGVFAGYDVTDVFIVSLSLGYISMFDSCRALTFVSLGFGAKKMLNNNAVIGNLNSIGKLGDVDSIMCSRAQAFPPRKMFVTELFADGKVCDIRDAESDNCKKLLTYALICSDVRKNADESGNRQGRHRYTGRLPDIAIADACDYMLIDTENLENKFMRVDAEVSANGTVTRTLALINGKLFIIVRGTPEAMISRCVGYRKNGAVYRMNDDAVAKMREAASEMEKKAETVIAVAAGRTDADTLNDYSVEDKLVLVGFIGLGSAFRVDPAAAVYKCRRAGIETVLRTDDSYYPAIELAKESGIITDEFQAVSAEDIRSTDKGLYIANQPSYKLFIGISDGQWRDVLQYRHENKKFVAVTAGSMDDLPIMQEADVSFVTETDVPDTLKRASDVIMLEGGFHVITYAISAAKTIAARIHAVTEYLTVAFTSALFATAVSLIIGKGLPLRLQELIFGGVIFNFLIALSLTFAGTDRHILSEKLKKYKTKPALSDFVYPVLYSLGAAAVIIAVSVFAGNTSALLAFTLLLILYAYTNISRKTIFSHTPLGAGKLTAVTAVIAAACGVLIYVPQCAVLFGYAPPDTTQYAIMFGSVAGYYALVQVAKLIRSCVLKKRSSPRFVLETEGAD